MAPIPAVDPASGLICPLLNRVRIRGSGGTREGQIVFFRSDTRLDWSKLNRGVQPVLGTEEPVFFCAQTAEASGCQTLVRRTSI